MAQDFLIDCKKYVIQRINNPGSYLIVESGNEKYYKKNIRRFEHLLANDVEKCTDAKGICIGQMVAVKDEKAFHRGRVADIFNRNCKTMYWILLIDSGKTVETHEESIYLIKDQKLKDQTANAFEISIHGIQPAALDINYDSPNSGGIFQLRKCNNWSPGAFKFVNNLFVKNPNIFVKIISCNKRISGEIYFVQDSDRKPVSLGQKLCDEGFAVFCDTSVKPSNNYSQTDDCSRGMEEKIPANALFSDSELHKALSKLNTLSKSSVQSRNLTIETDEAVSSQQLSCRACHIENNSSSSSANKTVSECKNSRFGSITSLDSNADRLSTSSISKKNLVCNMSPSNSSNTHNKEDGNEPTENIKLNVCRIVLRNLKLFNQQKHITEGHSQY